MRTDLIKAKDSFKYQLSTNLYWTLLVVVVVVVVPLRFGVLSSAMIEHANTLHPNHIIAHRGSQCWMNPSKRLRFFVI